MNNKPLVSIIMNCLNGEKYLKQAIDSLINQTYDNWECIFWDNNSTDRSKEIFFSYKDSRLKYFSSNERTTLYKARNLSLQKTFGEFISFLDTDDYWLSEKLKKQIEFFNKNEKLNITYGNCFIKNEKWFNKKKKALTNENMHDGNLYHRLLNKYFIGLPSIFIRKKIMSNFDERFEIIGDFDLIMRLSRNNNFGVIKEPLAYYRLHDSNFSLLNKRRHYQEMKLWKEENIENQEDISISIKSKFETLVSELEFLSLISEGKKLKALKILFGINNNKIKKFKYFLSVFLPLNIIRKFINS